MLLIATSWTDFSLLFSWTVHGMEYGFGAHEYPTSGIFEVEPRSCPGFIFRCSVLLGRNDMSYSEFRSFMERLSVKFHGDSYHLIAKNCNHFTDEVCQQLTGKPIPAWINRLARVGEGSLFLIILITEKLYFVCLTVYLLWIRHVCLICISMFRSVPSLWFKLYAAMNVK